MKTKTANNVINLVWVGLCLGIIGLTSTCRNSAITYAHSITPGTECRSINNYGCSDDNSAECITPTGRQWTCYTPKHMEPFCVEGDRLVLVTKESHE